MQGLSLDSVLARAEIPYAKERNSIQGLRLDFLEKGERRVKLIYIKPASSKGYLLVGLRNESEKCALTLSEEDFFAIGSPEIGSELSEAALSVMRASDERYRATLSALRILEYGDNTKKTLYAKLIKKGVSRECARDTVLDMVERGYINESAQLLRLVKREANESLLGPRRIHAKLASRGYSRSDIDSAIRTLTESGEIDFSLSKERLLEKKLTRDATFDEKRALFYKYGY